MRGRLGQAVQRSRHDPNAYTAKAREAAWQRFITEVDPDRALPEDERMKRADAARRAHLLRASLKAAATRTRRAKEAKR